LQFRHSPTAASARGGEATGYLFYTDDDTGFRLAGLAEFSPAS
jgi:hypothetical protein